MPVLPEVASMSVSPGLDLAAALGLLEHEHADAVLDRAARVEELALGEDLGGQAARDVLEAHDRRAADDGEDAVVDLRQGGLRCRGARRL
jgi:hypothetical protein